MKEPILDDDFLYEEDEEPKLVVVVRGLVRLAFCQIVVLLSMFILARIIHITKDFTEMTTSIVLYFIFFLIGGIVIFPFINLQIIRGYAELRNRPAFVKERLRVNALIAVITFIIMIVLSSMFWLEYDMAVRRFPLPLPFVFLAVFLGTLFWLPRKIAEN